MAAIKDWSTLIIEKVSVRLMKRLNRLAPITSESRIGITRVQINAPTNKPRDRKYGAKPVP
ncbi:hypothetical protein D3C81_2342200 [compost metagenome]